MVAGGGGEWRYTTLCVLNEKSQDDEDVNQKDDVRKKSDVIVNHLTDMVKR